MMNEENVKWKFADLKFPSNMVRMGSGFCFADRMGIFRFDTQHQHLLKIADVPKEFVARHGGLIHLYKSTLYVFDQGLLFILDLKKNIWVQFETGLKWFYAVSHWVEIDNNLCLYNTHSREIWYWNDKNKTFQIVEDNSKLYLTFMRKERFWDECNNYYDLGNLRFRLFVGGILKIKCGILEIRDAESLDLFHLCMKSYDLSANYLIKYRIFVQLQDIHPSGFFLVEGYIRKERKDSLIQFPVVISRLIHQLTFNYLVHVIEFSPSEKFETGYIRICLHGIDWMFSDGISLKEQEDIAWDNFKPWKVPRFF